MRPDVPMNELAQIVVDDFGGSPIAKHNMPCAVCRGAKAVLLMSEGRFLPCWSCHGEGWRTLRLPKWLRWLGRWLR
jgi:hypothetical protein